MAISWYTAESSGIHIEGSDRSLRNVQDFDDCV
jgi:hypothetical protein